MAPIILEIDNKIIRAIRHALDEEVISFIKIQKGEFNQVYKVVTNNKPVILRIFRQANFPEDTKLQWISDQLTKRSIPDAKILYYSRDNSIYPNGFMVTEFIEGINGMDAIENKRTTFKLFHEKLVSQLNSIHKIKLNHFGSITTGSQIDFIEERIQNVNICLKPMNGIIEKNISNKIIEIINQVLLPIRSKFQPVLIHSDASPVNSIYTPKGDVVLVDWDGAKSSIWIYDLAWLTYFGSHLSSYGSREKRRELIIEAFLKNHDLGEYTVNEIIQLEKAFHISFAAELLQYYYHNIKNMEAYKTTLIRLEELIH